MCENYTQQVQISMKILLVTVTIENITK